MNMPQVTGLSLILFLAAKPFGARAAEDSGLAAAPQPVTQGTKKPHLPAEYKRGDANYYPRAEFLKTRPTAVIIHPNEATQKDDSYFFTPKIRAPKEIFLEMSSDWVEPITPPDMPASLGVPPDQMQIREPQGDVQIALPTAPATFVAVTGNTTLPNGAVVKTGANGTAAVLFGGVDSARLMPNSAAAFQQTVTADTRTAEVDLTTGGVFSKVGSQVGVKGSYEVQTPFGNAKADGGDFVTVLEANRVDVLDAMGIVSLEHSDSKTAEKISSDGTGELKILRLPATNDSHQALAEDVESLTAALDFIPLANQKVKGLRDKTAGGGTLTDNEKAYLARIKQVPALIKLDLVPAPIAAPAPAKPKIKMLAPAPKVELPPVVAAPITPTNEEALTPIPIDLHADGTIALSGETVTLEALKPALAGIAKVNSAQPITITGKEKAKRELFRKVVALCKASKLKVTVVKPAPAATTPPEAISTPAPASPPPPPVIAVVTEPAPVTPPAPATTTPPNPSDAPAPRAETATAPVLAPSGPPALRAVVRTDGKINFKGATLLPEEFRKTLQKLALESPDQSILVRAGKTVPYEKLKAVLDICHDTNVKYELSAAPRTDAPPAAPAASEPATSNLPAPNLLMHPNLPEPASPTNSPPAGGP